MDQVALMLYKYADLGTKLPTDYELSPIEQALPNKKIKKLKPENERVVEELHPFDYEHAAGNEVPGHIAEAVRNIQQELGVINMASSLEDLGPPVQALKTDFNNLRRSCGLSEVG